MIGFNKELGAEDNWCPPKAWPARTRPRWCVPGRMARPSPNGVFPESKEFLAG
jgi:hypothetical protein